jgi:hypothetical protein
MNRRKIVDVVDFGLGRNNVYATKYLKHAVHDRHLLLTEGATCLGEGE